MTSMITKRFNFVHVKVQTAAAHIETQGLSQHTIQSTVI